MADEKLPIPTKDNAFNDGFLNFDISVKAMKKLNREIKVKLMGAMDAKVEYSKENVVIDLGTMAQVQKFWIVRNGALMEQKFITAI